MKYKKLSKIHRNIRLLDIETGKEMVKTAMNHGINVNKISEQDLKTFPISYRKVFYRGLEYYALKAHGLNPYFIMGVA